MNSSLVVWAVVLAAVYGLVRPGSAAGRALVAVTDSLSHVLNSAQEATR